MSKSRFDVERETVHGVERSHETAEAVEADVAATGRDNEVTEWKRPSSLDAPPPRPGMVQRWVRTKLDGDDDGRNAANKLREGWVPRKANTIAGGFHAPTIRHGEFGSIIGVEGMILCEMPERLFQQRAKYYRDKQESMTKAIENDLNRAEVAGQPHISRSFKSAVEVGKGRQPVVADDE